MFGTAKLPILIYTSKTFCHQMHRLRESWGQRGWRTCWKEIELWEEIFFRLVNVPVTVRWTQLVGCEILGTCIHIFLILYPFLVIASTVGELAGEGSLDVAVSISDKWHVTRNIWHMTLETWHVTPDTWHMTWFYFKTIICFWFWCYYPHTSRVSVSPVCRI